MNKTVVNLIVAFTIAAATFAIVVGCLILQSAANYNVNEVYSAQTVEAMPTPEPTLTPFQPQEYVEAYPPPYITDVPPTTTPVPTETPYSRYSIRVVQLPSTVAGPNEILIVEDQEGRIVIICGSSLLCSLGGTGLP